MNIPAALEEYAVAPPGKGAWVFLGLLAGVLPLIVLAAMVAFPEHRPPPVVLAITVPVIVAVVGLLVVASRRRSVRINGDLLEVKATLYSRSIALSSIDGDAARVIDLREHPENKPLLKSNGFAVPGLMAGNFRDRRWRKLFCLVTAPRVLVLPLRDGSRMLLSLVQPNRLLERIRAR